MRDAIATLFGQRLPLPLESTLERLLMLDRLQQLYDRAEQRADTRPFLERLLASMNVRPLISPSDLLLAPREGPVIAVANHPFGMIEGAILASVLDTVRPDVKIMANHLLAAMPEVARHCILVDPFGGAQAFHTNQRGLKESIEWVKQGRMLGVFPAGEVAHLNFRERTITDPAWNSTIARLIRTTGATVLPIYFVGANSAAFQILGLLHPRVRTALLPHELLNKHNRTIELRIGNPISPAKLCRYQDDLALIRYLRHRTYLLQNREKCLPLRQAGRQAVVAPTMSELMAAEIARIPPSQILVEAKELAVVLTKAREIPNIMREIGRLREVTFRAIGEGAGRSIDLDTFDDYYWHLFVWNRASNEVVGAYRLAPSDEIVEKFGVKGFYTNRLFAWKNQFLDQIQPAIELGRSFVRPEYQRSYTPLLLLWQGIGRFLTRNPRYKVLFGPVSISTDYSAASRQLMVRFLSAYRRSPQLAPLVRARSPFRTRPMKVAEDLVKTSTWDIEELSALVADVEVDRKGVPVLLRHYLKLGGELVAFNVDRHFANALDGLIVVDLRKTDVRVLERYMGKEGAAAFLSQ